MKPKPAKDTFDTSLRSFYASRLHVRKRPGMYFGCGGAAALPVIVRILSEFFIRHGMEQNAYSLSLQINAGSPPRFDLTIDGFHSELLTADELSNWFPKIQGSCWELNAAAAACNKFTLEIGTHATRRKAVVHEGRPARLMELIPSGKRRIRFACELDEKTFGCFDTNHLDSVAGFLRDQCALHAGMHAVLQLDRNPRHGAWWFPNGLASFVLQQDYRRYSLHPEPIRVTATDGPFHVDLAILFVHSGPSKIWTWVNSWPVQGGAHLEGLGDALRELFPDETAGCRTIPLSTNTDNSAVVNLPHTLVGAIHLRLLDPKFAGPTTDILIGEEVRAFVHHAVGAPLAQKWKEAREGRFAE